VPIDSNQLVYMDNHATTRVDPRVVEAMLPYFDEKYGNAHSVHAAGHEARDVVDAARQTIAAEIGADAKEIVFTSGATESNNLAIRGVAERDKRRGNHLISVTVPYVLPFSPLQYVPSINFAAARQAYTSWGYSLPLASLPRTPSLNGYSAAHRMPPRTTSIS
jgi:hypothetical protein